MKIKLIDGSVIDIELMTREEKEHFADPFNYTKEILEEWDSEPFKGIITNQDKVIIDGGANIGLFAIHVMPFADKIICVEPTPKHMAIQKDLFKTFWSATPIYVFHEQSALNFYTGKARFREERINTTMNALSNAGDSYEVDCITLYDLCKKYELSHVDLVKLDLEGSEVAAITVDTVKPVSHIVKKFLLETHPRSREMQDHFKGVFESAGYKVEYFDFNGSVIAYK
jgi:FkbM family methyltransferase